LTRRSSLVPLGAYVMDWESDYRGFVQLFTPIGSGFKQLYPTKTSFLLDFEYKKDVNLGLVVKQVRQIPAPGTKRLTTFLIDELATYTVRQGEFSDVFANHRLKCLWMLHSTNVQLTSSNLAQGIYTTGTLNYVSNGTIQTLTGPLDSWPNASNEVSSIYGLLNYWTTGSGTSQLAWSLNTLVTTNVSEAEPPIFTSQEISKELSVTYQTPMPRIESGGAPGSTTNDYVTLEVMPVVTPGALLQERTVTGTNVSVQTSFYWPKGPQAAGGYTAPLVQFVETRITGLTTDPIVLTNYFSQTYHPFHHNFVEEFIFEPRLEPGVPASTLAELNAANIQLIYVRRGFGTNMSVRALGFNHEFRNL
jgi:hypothetical protein